MAITNRRDVDLLEESDRGAVIVASAVLEEDLQELILNTLTTNKISEKLQKELLEGYGPLSGFHSKSIICYGFGLISKDIFEDLNKIRRLRNRFAHSSAEADFLASDVRDIVLSLNCCKEPITRSKIKRYSLSSSSPKRSKTSPIGARIFSVICVRY